MSATLPEFLLARIAEDEAATIGSPDAYAHRERAECEAKRRIVEDYRLTEEDGLFIAIRHLAAAYVEHPDYRDEWRA